jgi:mRNA interferase RelE/StbE
VHEIVILPQAMEDLYRLDKGTARRIFSRLDWLAENIEDVTPLPLRGSLSGLYKLRAGDWRIIYEIEHAGKVISVHRIGHRREIYR